VAKNSNLPMGAIRRATAVGDFSAI